MKFNDEMDHSCAYGKSSKSEGGRWEIAIASRRRFNVFLCETEGR